MKKRLAAGFLWFCCGWYAGAVLAFVLGIGDAFAPILGTALAAVVAGDPRHVIWPRPATARVVATQAAQTVPASAG